MRALPTLPTVPALRSAAVELLVFSGHLLLYPTGVRAERPGQQLAGEADLTAPDAPAALPTEGRAHPPVLLLHGFADNRSVFLRLRRALFRDGWRYVFALNQPLRTTDLRRAAEELAVRVEEVCARTGHRQVDLVGHSLGGVTARWYVQRLGGASRVRTLVTLGTPHSGTLAAPAFVPHPLLQQLRPGSPLLTDLAQPERSGCSTRFASFWSDSDLVMRPVETARLDHPDLTVRNVPVHGVGHLSLPVDSGVSAAVRAELTTAAPPDALGGTVEDAAHQQPGVA